MTKQDILKKMSYSERGGPGAGDEVFDHVHRKTKLGLQKSCP